MGACCSQHQGTAVAAPKLPVLLVAEAQPAKQPEGATADPAPVAKPRHAIDLKWDTLEVPRWDVDTEDWETLGGGKLLPLLEHVDLVDLRYIIENAEAGRPVPRWQDVPRGARINATNVYRIQKCGFDDLRPVLSVLVLSYPWLDKTHPDKQVSTLRRLLPCLKAFLNVLTRNHLGLGGDEHSTVGLMMDYTCLPQKRNDGEDDRSDEEKARFKRGLNTINEWYLHPETTVIIFDVDMPSQDSGHGNLRPYSQRGWCFFEFRASSIVKNRSCLWSLRGFEDESIKDGSGRGKYYYAMVDATMKVARPAPMSPEHFSEVLRDGVATGDLAFTAGADLEVVEEQYGKAFDNAFAGAVTLDYSRLGWTDEEMKTLAHAVMSANKRVRRLKLDRVKIGSNPCSEVGIVELIQALDKCNIYSTTGGCCVLNNQDIELSKAGWAAVLEAVEYRNIKLALRRG